MVYNIYLRKPANKKSSVFEENFRNLIRYFWV